MENPAKEQSILAKQLIDQEQIKKVKDTINK